jgi:hypothetical protein
VVVVVVVVATKSKVAERLDLQFTHSLLRRRMKRSWCVMAHGSSAACKRCYLCLMSGRLVNYCLETKRKRRFE